MSIRALLCAAVVFGTFPCARADVITQYDRATFSTALSDGTVSGQNFDTLAAGTTLSTLNGVTYSASLGNAVVTDTYLTTTPPNGLGSTSAGYFQGYETATFAFATPITAFGIDINTFAPTPADFTATLDTGATAVSNFDVFPGNATGQFIGLTDSVPFSTVTIASIPDPGDDTQYSYTLDSLVYGQASAITPGPVTAPEPGTAGLLLSVVVLAGGFVRRLTRAS